VKSNARIASNQQKESVLKDPHFS